MPTATAPKPRARARAAKRGARRKPKPPTAAEQASISARKLTLAEAADQWEHAKREIDRLMPQLKEAASVLLEHFERTGRLTYKGRIGLTIGAARLILDQGKVTKYLSSLGLLEDYQKRSTPSRSLTLLKPPSEPVPHPPPRRPPPPDSSAQDRA